jgi:hypothetical protein
MKFSGYKVARLFQPTVFKAPVCCFASARWPNSPATAGPMRIVTSEDCVPPGRVSPIRPSNIVGVCD